MNVTLPRLEIDVMQANELAEASELAVKHKIPALVVHQSLASDALIYRGKVNGKFKIITPVDWQHRDAYGLMKLRGLPVDALETDGFEILLTPNKSLHETKNEANVLTKFIHGNISPMSEIRFVLGVHNRNTDQDNYESIYTMCDALLSVPMPNYIRTDHQLKLQVSKANTTTHNQLIAAIRSRIAAPIKLSGNITSVKCINGSPNAARFAVSVLQTKSIIKEYQSAASQNAVPSVDP